MVALPRIVDEAAQLAQLATRVATSAGADRAAANELCRLLAPRLRLFLLRRERDSARAQDLAQDALLIVLGALAEGRIDDPARVASYAMTVCRSHAIADARKQQRRSDLLAQVAHEATCEMPPLFTIDYAALGACFNKLPFRERQTVFETFMLDRDTNAIALTLETSAGNVRVLRHRAIALLRRCLGIDARGAP